jgi:hypothetical protein
MQCPICDGAELQHSPGKEKLDGLLTRPDIFTCPNCRACAEQLSGDKLRFAHIPTPYAFPIGPHLDKPVPLGEAQRVGSEARQWLRVRSAVETGEPAPGENPSVLRRDETLYLHVPDVRLGEVRTRKDETLFAEINQGDLYLTDRNLTIAGTEVTRISLAKITSVIPFRGRPGFRVIHADRQTPGHVVLSSSLDHHLMQLALSRLTNLVSPPQLDRAHVLGPSSYKPNLRALGSIWRKGSLARAVLVAVAVLLLGLCLLWVGVRVFAPEPAPTATEAPAAGCLTTPAVGNSGGCILIACPPPATMGGSGQEVSDQ